MTNWQVKDITFEAWTEDFALRCHGDRRLALP